MMKRLGLFLALACLAFAGAAEATITVTKVAGVTNNTAAQTSFSTTTTANITAGSTVLVVMNYSAAITGLSFTDGTNTYTCGATPFSNSGVVIMNYCYATNVTAVSSGATVTASWTTGLQYKVFEVVDITGTTGAPSVVNAASANSNVTPVSYTSGSVTNGYLVVNSTGYGNAGAYTQDTNFTALTGTTGIGAGQALGYKTQSGTGMYTYSGTLASASQFADQYYAFAPTGLVTNYPKMTLLGVGR